LDQLEIEDFNKLDDPLNRRLCNRAFFSRWSRSVDMIREIFSSLQQSFIVDFIIIEGKSFLEGSPSFSLSQQIW